MAPAAKELTLSERVDAELAKAPEVSSAKVSPLIRDFFLKISPRLRLGETTSRVLEIFTSPDVKADRLAQTIRLNPYFEQYMTRMISALAKRQSRPSLEALIVLYGMANSRNLLVALQLLRTAREVHPEWGADDKLNLKPPELLKYALLAELGSGGEKDPASVSAFYAGLVFDVLGLLAADLGQDPKRLGPMIDSVFKTSLKAAQIAAELCKTSSGFKYTRVAFGACLLKDIGKPIMAMLNPDYFKFADDISKRDLPRATRFFAETRKFGCTHAELSALVCLNFKLIRPVAAAVRHHHDPYLLKAKNKDLYLLSSVICLATLMANKFKVVTEPNDPAFEDWKSPDLRDFIVKPIDMIAVLQAVAKKGS